MDAIIKKVGQRDGQDRFVLVDAKTRKIVTVADVSEQALRRFFRQHGTDDQLIDSCLQRARQRYQKPALGKPAVDEAADTVEDEGLLFELGLMDERSEES